MQKVRPFSCGSQYLDWEASNCERCTKQYVEPNFNCEIQAALLEACMGDGYITKSMAKRMGFEHIASKYVWCCPEVEWTEAWKKEYAKILKTIME
jgi:hypothetical protein